MISLDRLHLAITSAFAACRTWRRRGNKFSPKLAAWLARQKKLLERIKASPFKLGSPKLKT